MVFGASEYSLLSGDFGDWDFWLLGNLSAVDESFTSLVMCGRLMVRHICGYSQSTLGEKYNCETIMSQYWRVKMERWQLSAKEIGLVKLSDAQGLVASLIDNEKLDLKVLIKIGGHTTAI